MCWASGRETTRYEDMAYCLLGIFDVNMPLMYGEGEKAFRRLQEEIIKLTTDFSIFAWRKSLSTNQRRPPKTRTFCGLLAQSPNDFSGCTSIVRRPTNLGGEVSVSNKRIKTSVQILSDCAPNFENDPRSRYILPLDCSWDFMTFLGVRLRKCGPDKFIRDDPWNLAVYGGPWYNAPRERYFLIDDPVTVPNSQFIVESRSHVLQIALGPDIWVYNAWPWSRFDDEDFVFFVSEDISWDSCAIRIAGPLPVLLFERKVEVGIDCIFYALGWSSLETDQLQCTLVDYSLFTNVLDGALEGWNFSTPQVLDELLHRKIPKWSAAIFKVEETEFRVFVSFPLTLIENSSICQNKFWKIAFYWDVYEDGDLPPISHGEWRRA